MPTWKNYICTRTCIYPLHSNYGLINALVRSTAGSLLQQIKMMQGIGGEQSIPSIQEGVSGTSIEDPTYDVAGCWTAAVADDDDGDGGRGWRGAVVGDQVDLVVLLLHCIRSHKFIVLLSHEMVLIVLTYRKQTLIL